MLRGEIKIKIKISSSEIILYPTPQGEIKIEVILQDETVWLTQRAVGELFGVSKKTISEHLDNIYKSNELQREARGCLKSPSHPLFIRIPI